jgi:hypothetical protein
VSNPCAEEPQARCRAKPGFGGGQCPAHPSANRRRRCGSTTTPRIQRTDALTFEVGLRDGAVRLWIPISSNSSASAAGRRKLAAQVHVRLRGGCAESRANFRADHAPDNINGKPDTSVRICGPLPKSFYGQKNNALGFKKHFRTWQGLHHQCGPGGIRRRSKCRAVESVHFLDIAGPG